MATDEILRLHYYERQYLGAADLEDQQTYLRDMRRRHNLGPHTWGIVTGLDLTEIPVAGDPTAVDVFVQPGMAIDGFGREIIVMSPVKLDPLLFDSFANQQHRDVWISYDQLQAQQPTGGFAQCDVTNQFGRIVETYKFEIAPPQPPNDDVVVNGKSVNPKSTDITIPADDSVPFQEFPDDSNDPRWLIQLGTVNWDGVNHKFLPATPHERLIAGRLYAGLVGQNIYGPVPMPDPANKPATDGPRFFIQPRFPAATPDAFDFAEVVGRMQVDGRLTAKKDVQIHGGQLQFLDQGGKDDNVPLWMQRTAGNGGIGNDLRVHIGDSDKDATTRLSIGPKSGSSEKAVLAVKADDTVDILTGSLNFGDTKRQMLNLAATLHYGIGVQTANLYFRSESGFRWYKGGKHADDPTSADNGTLQLSLDDSGNLNTTADINVPGHINFGASERQMLNLWNANYGIGIQDFTLYFRTDTDFCWFLRGVHANGRSDPGGGVLSMKLDSGSNLSVSGNFSAAGNGTIGGNLSVGGNEDISGNLTVGGSSNLFKAVPFTRAIQNGVDGGGNPIPAQTVVAYAGFSQIYTAFVVFQGFSIWGNGGNLAFSNFNNDPDVNAIPQHAYARIIGTPTTTQTTVETFCNESLKSNEGDNTVLFTLVVLGRP